MPERRLVRCTQKGNGHLQMFLKMVLEHFRNYAPNL